MVHTNIYNQCLQHTHATNNMCTLGIWKQIHAAPPFEAHASHSIIYIYIYIYIERERERCTYTYMHTKEAAPRQQDRRQRRRTLGPEGLRTRLTSKGESAMRISDHAICIYVYIYIYIYICDIAIRVVSIIILIFITHRY